MKKYQTGGAAKKQAPKPVAKKSMADANDRAMADNYADYMNAKIDSARAAAKAKAKPKPKMKMGGKMAKSGGSFPDLNKDGKVTKADILVGRGVIKARKGAKMSKGCMSCGGKMKK